MRLDNVKYRILLRTALTAALFLMLESAPIFAQGAQTLPTLRMEAAPSKVYQGESLRLLIHLDNAALDTPPETAYLANDFGVEYLGAQNRNSTRITIINGKRQQEEERGVTFNYQLTPKKDGPIEISAPEIVVEGKPLEAPPITIEVIPPSDQDLVKLEVSAGSDSVYPLTPFDVTLSVFVRELTGRFDALDPVRDIAKQVGPPALLIAWAHDEQLPDGLVPQKPLQDWITPYQSDAGGFSVNGLRYEDPFDFGFGFGPSRRLPAMFLPEGASVERPGPDGSPVRYRRYDFKRTFIAERTGPVTFDAASLKGTFVRSEEGAEKLTSEPIYALSKPLEVTIREIPSDGRPSDYIGAFGKFRFSAELAPHSAKVGEAITLSLTLEGNGSVLNVQAPKLEENPEIAKNFKVYPPTEETADGRVRWTWSLRPLNEGNVVFPELTVSYFDVANEKFETLRSKPIPLTVAENKSVPIAPSAALTEKNPLSLQRSESGIFGNRTDPGSARSRFLSLTDWGIAVGSIFGGSFVLLGFLTLARRRGASARTLLIRRIQEGRALLDAALFASKTPDSSSGNAAGFTSGMSGMSDISNITAGRGVVRAFLLPLADRLAGNPDALTGAEIEQLLGRFPTAQNENASATLDDLRHLFAEIERSRYAAGGATGPTLYPSHLSFSVDPAKNTPDHEVVRGWSGENLNIGSITPEKVRSLFERWSALLLTLPPKQLARLSEERGAAYQPSGRKNLPLVLLALILPLGIVGCRSADSDTEAQFAEAIRLFNEADQAEANPAGDKGAEASEGDASDGVAPDKGVSEGDAQALFLKSAAVYEGMMHAGTVSGPILYNQGNAYWRGGQPARALAAWRKAEAFLPSDPYLKANIDLAVSHAAAKRPFLDTLFFWQRKIAVPTIGLISIFCAALTGVGILAWFLTDRASRRRKIIRRAALAAAALFVVFSASFFVEQARFAPNRHAILSTESVLRKGASATYEPVLRDKLPALTELELRDRRDGWLELALPDGTLGYLAESDAEVW